MRFTPLPMVVAFSIAASALAQPIEIPGPPSTTTTNCNLIPWSPQWSTANGEYRYQLVVPSSLLGAQSFVIDEIAFHTCSPASSTFSSPMLEIRMSHTSLVPPSGTFAANLPKPQVVHPAGPFTYARTGGQWSPIRLPIPFVYDGASALTVEIRYTNGTSTSPSLSRDQDTGQSSLNYYRVIAWGPGAYNATTTTGNGALDARGLYLRLDSVGAAGLLGNGTGRIGSTVVLDLRAPADVGLRYQAATSLGRGPTPIGSRSIFLTVDPLFVASVRGVLPTVFVAYAGTITAAGRATAGLAIPPVAALVGTNLHTAFVTLAASGVRSVSNTWSVQVQP